jgi:hypothetical protein
MVPEGMVREAWLRAEALCECRKDAHGHPGHCNQLAVSSCAGLRLVLRKDIVCKANPRKSLRLALPINSIAKVRKSQ